MSKKTRIGLRALICAGALFAMLAAASSGQASIAQLTSVGPDYTADPGEANNVTFMPSSIVLGGGPFCAAPIPIDIADAGATITPRWGFLHCWGCDFSPGPGQVFCALENASSSITANLGDMNDLFFMNFPGRSTNVSGGTGDDGLFGGSVTDTLRGASGDDTLDGRGGNDTLLGESQNDTLDGGAGDDVLSGGTSRDTADYTARFARVVVSIDSVPGDGDPTVGEADNVLTNVENVDGGSGGDDLFGSGLGNGLSGNAGGDWLAGNGGNDSLDGGSGGDWLEGGIGDDHIYAQDGEHDAIDCGPGFDVVYAEPFDFIIGGCEAVLFGN